MEFRVDHPILYVIVAILVAVVMGQSVYFLVKAWRRAKELGMDGGKLKKTVRSAALFTIAPAVAIIISVITLSKKLGLPLPWLRLSVVGSMSYETVAANSALAAFDQSLGSAAPITATQYVNVLLVMTLSIMMGIWLVPLIGKKLQSGMSSLSKRDAKWADIFSNSLFIGMISAFLGYVFCDVSRLWSESARITTSKELIDGVEVVTQTTHSATSGLVPVFVMLVSAVITAILGTLMKKPKLKWLGEYALPVSLVLGMAAAIPLTMWLA